MSTVEHPIAGGEHPDVSEKTADLRVRLDPATRDAWDSMLTERKISGVAAVQAIVTWITSQEPLLQSLILGQVPAGSAADVARLALERMGAKPSGKYSAMVGSVGAPRHRKSGQN